MIENKFCPEEYDIKIKNVYSKYCDYDNDDNDNNEGTEEEFTIKLHCINFPTIIVNTLLKVARKRLNTLYKINRYLKQYDEKELLDLDALQINLKDSFHENLSLIIQFDKWNGKVYVYHTIHCDRRRWKKVNQIDEIINSCNDNLMDPTAKDVLTLKKIDSIINNLFESLTKLLPKGNKKSVKNRDKNTDDSGHEVKKRRLK